MRSCSVMYLIWYLVVCVCCCVCVGVCTRLSVGVQYCVFVCLVGNVGCMRFVYVRVGVVCVCWCVV